MKMNTQRGAHHVPPQTQSRHLPAPRSQLYSASETPTPMALRRVARTLTTPTPISSSSSHRLSTTPTAPTQHTTPSYLAHHLLDEFSQPPDSRDPARLRRLAFHLTAPAAESVLLRLPSWRHALDFFHWAAAQPGFRHSCYSYNAMAALLSRHPAQLNDLAADLLSRRCPMTPGALGYLLRCLGAAGLPDTAARLFDSAGDIGCTPNSYTYNCLLDALGKAGRADDAKARFQEMVARCGNDSVDKYTLTSLLRCYCNAGRADDVRDVFGTMSERGWVDGHVLTVLAVAFSKWGMVESAAELIERMEGLGERPSEKTLSVLVHGFVKQGRVDKAMEMFDKMVSYSLRADLPMYSVLIEGLCEGKEIGKALELFEDMKKTGVAPDVRLLKKMIMALCRQGDFANVGRLINENTKSLEPGSLVSLCNTILDELVGHGEVEGAYRILASMISDEQEIVDAEIVGLDKFSIKKDVKPNSHSFNIVICGLCKVQKLDMALELMKKMLGLGCEGKLLMYNDLIHELCNVDRLEEGYELFNKMQDLGFVPTEFTYNSIFYGLCRRKDPVAAVNLLKEMRSRGHKPWIKNCTEMVQQLCFTGRIPEALHFLDEMLNMGFLPDIVTYSAAIDGMCKTGDVDSALGLFRDISSKSYLPDVVAHNILINGFGKSGKLNEAEEIMEEMLEKGLMPSVVTYNLMIDVWCKSGKVEKALHCLNRMIDEEKPPTVVTYTSLIDGLFSAGRADEAVALWSEMREKGCAPNEIAYTALVNGLCKCGRVEIALSYYEEMSSEGFELDIFSHLFLINSLISNGNVARAYELLQGVLKRSSTYNSNPRIVGLINRAVKELSQDERTSSDIRTLIEKGLVPMVQPMLDEGDGRNDISDGTSLGKLR